MYIDTANLQAIEQSFQFSFFQGVTTNPTLLLREGKKRESMVQEILRRSTGTVFVQAVGDTADDLYQDCQKIIQLNNQRIGLKIPANKAGLQVMERIKQENTQQVILATAIFSVEQSLLSALAGSDWIAPYVNRMEENQLNPYKVIEKTRKIFDQQKLSTRILAASFKNTEQVVNALVAGAHTVTLSDQIFEQMMHKKLAVHSIEQFHRDWEQLCQTVM